MAIAFVNATAKYDGAASTTMAADAFAATAGNTIVVGIRAESDATITGIADTAGNTYYRLFPPAAIGSVVLQMWYASGITGHATNVVTVTFGSSVGRGVATAQFSGLAAASPLDQLSGAAVNNAAITAQYPLTTSVAESVFVMYAQMNTTSATDWTVSTGFTIAAQDASKVTVIAYDLHTTIQSAVSPSCTHADGSLKSMQVAAFNADPPGVSGGGGVSRSRVQRGM